MSVDKWAYSSDKCEGQYCCGDCDFCKLANEYDEEAEEDG